MSRAGLRTLLLATSSLLSLGAVLSVTLLWPHETKVRCLPYLLVPREMVCVEKVYYVNPDGSRVMLGTRGDFLPMPRPPQERP